MGVACQWPRRRADVAVVLCAKVRCIDAKNHWIRGEGRETVVSTGSPCKLAGSLPGSGCSWFAGCRSETHGHPDRRAASRSMAQRGAAKPHVMLTPSAQLRACSGRDRAGWHCRISEIVHSAHYDSGFHGRDTAVFYGTLYHCTRPCHTDPFGAAQGMLRAGSRWSAAKRHRAPRRVHVILTPSAQLRACSGRDLTARHRGIIVAVHDVSYPTEKPCHTDPFGAAQGMLREGSRRMAL
jgi:hypothetical protein